MFELYLSGKRIKLDKGAVITYNLQNNNFFKPSEVLVSHTNTFKIPIAPNLEVLEDLGLIGHNSRAPYTKLSAHLSEDGIQFYRDGIAKITGKKGDHIDINIKFEAGLFESLKGLKFSDLDLSDLDHDLNIDQLSVLSADYYYPLNIYFTEGKASVQATTNTAELLDLLPVLSEKKLFSEIIAQAGYEYDWELIENTDFAESYITPIKGVLNIHDGVINGQNATSIDASKSETTTYNLSPTSGATTLISQALTDGYHTLKIVVNEMQFTDLATDFDTGGGSHSFDVFTATLKITSGSITLLYTDNDYLQTIEQSIYLPTNDDLNIEILFIDRTNNHSYDIRIVYDIQVLISSISNSAFSFPVKFTDIIPDFGQLDYIKEVMNRYGLFKKKDKDSNKLYFKRFEDIFKDRANALDWTDKIQNEVSVKYHSTTFGQINEFEFADGYKPDGTDNANFLIDNEHLENKKTLFKSKFGGGIYFGGTDVDADEQAIYEVELGGSGEVNTVRVNSVESKLVSKTTDSTDRTITVLGIDSGAVTNNMAVTKNLQTNIDDHYSTLTKIIGNLEIKTFKVYLTLMDIYDFDPFVLVYSKKESSYFFVLSIKNYKDCMANIEMIKLPPDIIGETIQWY